MDKPSTCNMVLLRRFFLGCSAMVMASSLAPAVAQGEQDAFNETDEVDPFQPRNQAGFVGYSVNVSPQVTWTDNVNLDPEGQEISDGLASVELRGGLLVDRVRFTGIVSGRLEFGSYFDVPVVNGTELYDQYVVDQNIAAAGTLVLSENLFYFDAAAASETRALNERSRFSPQSLAANDQQANTFAFSVSPYILTEFANEGTFEARYRYLNVAVEDGDAVDGVDDFLNDSEIHEVSVEYSSGRLLDRLAFSVRAYANHTFEYGSDVLPEVDFDQETISTSIRYPLSRKVSAIGTVGYDHIDTNDSSSFDDDDLSGVFWKAGLLAVPGRRTEARLEVGERYGGMLIEGSAEYRYSSRLQFRANLNRQFITSAALRANQSGVLQSETLAYTEELRQLQSATAGNVLDRSLLFSSDAQEFSQRQSGLSTTNTASFSVLAFTNRDDFLLRVGYDDADFGFQEVNTVSLNGAWNRRLTRVVSMYVRGSYQDSSVNDTGALADCITALSIDPATAGLSVSALTALCQDPTVVDADIKTASIVGGIDYQIFKDIAAFLQFSRTQRFADSDDLEYKENAITAGLTVEF